MAIISRCCRFSLGKLSLTSLAAAAEQEAKPELDSLWATFRGKKVINNLLGLDLEREFNLSIQPALAIRTYPHWGHLPLRERERERVTTSIQPAWTVFMSEPSAARQ